MWIRDRVKPGDVVVTQDYGLAAMCLARNARVLSQDGMEYTADNIDGLLLARHTAKKIRSGGGRLKGPKKRTKAQDEAYAAMDCIMSGGATDAQIGSFITALRMKGETIDEITGFARVMRSKAAVRCV